MNHRLRILLFAFLTSACQYILFVPIFFIYMVLIPWPPISWILVISYIIIPIVSAFGYCFLIYRDNFALLNRGSKNSAYRFAGRLISVFCFLLIGYIAGRKQLVPTFISDLLNNFGEHAGTFESFLTNPVFYFLVAIFPIVFAFAEYRFVGEK